jgi:hypothetical protein
MDPATLIMVLFALGWAWRYLWRVKDFSKYPEITFDNQPGYKRRKVPINLNIICLLRSTRTPKGVIVVELISAKEKRSP